MRLISTTAVAATIVLAGFAGSMATAHAMSAAYAADVPAPTAAQPLDLLPFDNPLDPAPMPRPLPDLLPASPAAEQAGTDLVVGFRADETAAPRQARLTCSPVGGEHPRAAEACAALDAAAAAGRDPFAPVPPDQACTFIYGGPQTATTTGTWRGAPVQAAFSRTNGCEIARWDAIAPVLDLGSTG